MKRGIKRFIVICAAVAVMGLLMTAAGFAMGGVGDMHELSRYSWIYAGGGETVTKSLGEGESFSLIDISVSGDMDIYIREGEDSDTRISYGEEMAEPELYVKDGTLTVNVESYSHEGVYLNLDFDDSDTMVLEVFCPENTELESVHIASDSGDVEIYDAEVGKAEIISDYGDIKVENSVFDEINVTADSGDVSMSDVDFGVCELTMGCGDLKMLGVTSESLNACMNKGDCNIEGSLEGTTEIKAGIGDIALRTPFAESLYSIVAYVDIGELEINGNEISTSDANYQGGSGEYQLTIETGSGDVELEFAGQ